MKLKITKTTITMALFTIVGVLWFPFYIAAWLLRIIARFLLAIAYFGLLNGKMAKDIMKSLFTWYDRKI
jgi:hypothetical protein